MTRLSPAQQRLVETIRAHQRHSGVAEYWPVVTDWLNLAVNSELQFRNQNRTIDTLVRRGVLAVDDDGCFQLTEAT